MDAVTELVTDPQEAWYAMARWAQEHRAHRRTWWGYLDGPTGLALAACRCACNAVYVVESTA